MLLYVRSLPDLPLYRIDGWVRFLFHGMQILGAGLLLWTPWDLKEFVGLRQWERHRKGKAEATGRNERLFTGKGYGLVRHPLYLGCSLLLAFHPVQTRNSAATATAVIAYFYIGTFFEERRLVRQFGEEYREYQRRVPRLLPAPAPGDRQVTPGKGAAPVKEVLAFLARAYPKAHVLLDHRNPFELLVATVLAAQCTDERVNAVTPPLFRAWPRSFRPREREPGGNRGGGPLHRLLPEQGEGDPGAVRRPAGTT